MQKLKEKIKKFLLWIWGECKDVKTLALLLVVIAVVYSPVWAGYLLYGLFGWTWCLAMATTCLVFWAGPFTPFFPLCIAITLAIKRLFQKFGKKSSRNSKDKQMPLLSNEEQEKELSYAKLFSLFMIGCVFGVLTEGVFCLFTKGHWESHVVCIWGPFNILYGMGAVAFYVGAVKLRRQNIGLRVAIMMIAATALELICGMLLKNFLGMRAWNYSDVFMNYQGMICLPFSFVWGLAALVFCLLYPKISRMLKFAKGRIYRVVCSILTVFMVVNIGLAGVSIFRWSERHRGVPATTKMQKTLDFFASDEWMESKFMDWKFLD